MQEKSTHSLKSFETDTSKDTKKLFTIFYNKPQTRRMAVTELGRPDITYLITQTVFDWVASGKAEVVKYDYCQRSGHKAEYISTNPALFKKR